MSWHTIIELAHEWGWDLLDLALTRGSLPTDPAPSGAFIGQLPTDPLATRLRELNCPTVRLGNLPNPDDELLPAVLPDRAATGRLAAEHLVSRGFKDVAFVGHDPWSDSRSVYDAFREQAKALGSACHLLRLKSKRQADDESDEALYERRAGVVGEWLGGLPKPVAVLGYNDAMAAKICTMCQRAGLAVPEDVALLGIGNDPLTCELSPVALSSIDTGHEERGRQAALLLRRLMKGEPAPAEPVLVLPAGVVARRSTEVLAVGDPMVARAMRFMWDHLEQDLSVDKIASEVGVSRRKLERGFRQELGRGINVEIRRRRLEQLCLLLRSTDHSIADLAPMVGFKSTDYLHRTFQRAFDITPRRYRVRERGGE